MYSFAPPLGETVYHYAAPQLTLSFGGSVVSLPQDSDGIVDGVAGSAYGASRAYYPGEWVVAVPAGAAVELTASEAGFSQRVELRSAARVGSVPTVLYRSASGPLALDLQPSLARSLVVRSGSARVSFPVTLEEAALSYFQLDSADPSAGLPPDEAYLFVNLSVASEQSASGQWFFDPTDPASTLALTVGGKTLAPRFAPSFAGPGQSLDGVFGFVVPAGLVSARVTVSVGSGPAVYFEGNEELYPQAEPATGTARVTFPLRFPSPSSSPAAVSSAPSSTAAPPASSSTPTSHHTVTTGRRRTTASSRHHRAPRVGGPWLPIGTGVGGAVVVVLAAVVISRRTRLVEPRPVEPNAPPDAASTEACVDGPSPPGDVVVAGAASGESDVEDTLDEGAGASPAV